MKDLMLCAFTFKSNEINIANNKNYTWHAIYIILLAVT